MLTARPNLSNKTAPASPLKDAGQSLQRVSGRIAPQPIGVAAVAALLIGIFLSGLFQLRSYQQPSTVAAGGAKKAVFLPIPVKAAVASSAATARQRATLASSVMKPSAPQASASLGRAIPARLTGQSYTRRWRDEHDEDDGDHEGKRGKGHSKHKRKHGKGKHGH